MSQADRDNIPDPNAKTRRPIMDTANLVIIEVPTAMAPLSTSVVSFLEWLRDEGLEPRVDWGHMLTDNCLRIIFGTSLPTRVFGEVIVDSLTGDPVRGVLYFGQRDPGTLFTELPVIRERVHKHLVATNRETYFATSRYTTRGADGIHSHINTSSYPEALDHARNAGHQVVELIFAYVEAQPLPRANFIPPQPV